MATQIRYATDRVATNAQLATLAPLAEPSGFWRALEAAPYAFDLFFAMRWIDAKQNPGPRLGYAARQQPSLIFAPAMLSHVRVPARGLPPVISQYAFGLFGPGGPLPLHLTELAHERSVTAGDKTLSSFLNVFHHRAALMFYRAWADAQPTTSLDRPEKDNFSRFVSSIAGYGLTSQAMRDEVSDHAKRHVTGHLSRSVRTPESLQRVLEIAFGFPVQVKEWTLAWLALPPSSTALDFAWDPCHCRNMKSSCPSVMTSSA
jgi:type VI secretion system protein ImpH